MGFPKAQSSSQPVWSLLQAQQERPKIPEGSQPEHSASEILMSKSKIWQEKHVATSQAGTPNSSPAPPAESSVLLFSPSAAQQHNPCSKNIPPPGETTCWQHGKESFSLENSAGVSPGSHLHSWQCPQSQSCNMRNTWNCSVSQKSDPTEPQLSR